MQILELPTAAFCAENGASEWLMAQPGLCSSVYLPAEPDVVLCCGMIGIRWGILFVYRIAMDIFLRRLSLAMFRFAPTQPVLNKFDVAYQVHDLLPCY